MVEFQNYVDNTYENNEQKENIVQGVKEELSALKEQTRGTVEKFSEDQIDNVSEFIEYGKFDKFVVRARADGYDLSLTKEKVQRVNKLVDNLKNKGLVVIPDTSTGNNALARERALTPLDQLEKEDLSKIKDKIEFDVKSVSEKDEKGTYRMASFDVYVGDEKTSDIQNTQPTEEPENIPQDDDLTPELNLSTEEKKIFSSWEELRRGLGIPVVIKAGNEYYSKYSFYKVKDGELFSKHSDWKKSSENMYNKTKSKEGLKANSIVIDASDLIKKSGIDIGKLQKNSGLKLKERLDILNKNFGNDRFALNELYKTNRKGSGAYVARAKENDVIANERLLASK